MPGSLISVCIYFPYRVEADTPFECVHMLNEEMRNTDSCCTVQREHFLQAFYMLDGATRET